MPGIGLTLAGPAAAQGFQKEYKSFVDTFVNGDYRNAAKLGEKVLPGLSRLEGERSTELMWGNLILAISYLQTDQVGLAEEILTRNLQNIRKYRPRDLYLVGYSKFCLGVVEIYRKDDKKSWPLISDGLKKVAIAKGPKSNELANLMTWGADAYYRTGELSKARTWFKQALEIYLAGSPRDNNKIIAVLVSLGSVSHDLENPRERDLYYRKAMDLGWQPSKEEEKRRQEQKKEQEKRDAAKKQAENDAGEGKEPAGKKKN